MATSMAPAFAAPPPELEFSRVATETGPSHNTIFAVTQDRQGFLWVGTQDGLNRFDGYEFRVYRHDPRDPHSLSSNRVRAVLEDSAGRLWIGTSAGIDRLDRARQRFEHAVVPPPEAMGDGQGGGGRGDAGRPGGRVDVLELVEGPSGTLWAATSVGLLRRGAADERWSWALELATLEHPQAASVGVVRRVREAADGTVWLLVEDARPGQNRLLRLGRDGDRQSYAAGVAVGLDLDAHGRPWLDAAGPSSLEPFASAGPVAAGERREVKDVVLTADGGVWVGTSQGVEWRPDGSPEIARFLDEAPEMLSSHVTAVFEDRTGIVWLGTENGLFFHDPHAKTFRHLGYARPARSEAGGPPVSALAEDRHGRVWAGAFVRGGLFRLEDRDGDRGLVPVETALPPQQVWALLADGDELLVGLSRALCAVPLDGGTVRCERTEIPCQAMLRDARGRLWRSGPSSLMVLDEGVVVGEGGRERWREHRYTPSSTLPAEAEVVQLLADAGSLWVATWGGPLRRFDLEREVFETVPRRDAEGWEQTSPVLDLHRDQRGVLWLGTGDGLSRYSREEGFTHFVPSDGLPGANVYSVLGAGDGLLWLGTNRGLVRLDPDASPEARLRTFAAAEGVVNVEYNRNARLEVSDGRLLFGGLLGITELHPAEIVDNPHAPGVALTEVEVLGEDGPRRIEPYGLERVVMAPSDSAITIGFVALGFTHPSRNRHAYRLEGVDREWVEAGNERHARYTALQPGEYVFRVRAANNDGVWNDEGASLAIEVLPPFWRTWWFRALVLAAIVAGLTVAYRLRVTRLIEMERMRLRIAGDLHDELGSDLSGIALAAARIGGHDYLEERDRQHLSEMQTTALQVMEGLRDIVWYVNPEHDTVQSLSRRMRAIAATQLAGIEHRFVGDPVVGERSGRGASEPERAAKLDMQTRRDLLLIYKEFLHNVVRHAGASEVEICLSTAGGGLRLVVADDGAGFEPAAASDGTGLSSVRRRARRIGAELEIDSAPGRGTRVRLEREGSAS